MKKIHKVIAVLGCISLLLVSTFAFCSADTSYIGDYFGTETLTPYLIIFGGVTTGEPGGSIAIPNSQFPTGNSTKTEISIFDLSLGEGDNQGWYNISVRNSGSSISFETDFNFGWVTMYYPDFYANPNVTRTQRDLTYRFSANVQDVTKLSIDYYSTYYLGNGDLNEVNLTDIVQSAHGATSISYDVVDIATPEISRYGSITDLTVEVYFEGSQREFSIEKHSVEEYGFGLGPRIFTNLNVTEQVINPNILEWVSTSLSSFLDTDIFPDISIGEMLFVIVAIPLAITFLKFFAGG